MVLDYARIKGVTVKKLAEDYSIGYSTATRHIHGMLKGHRSSKKLSEISDCVSVD